MTSTSGYSLRPIGVVRSPLTAREEAPRQGSEGAPEAWVEIDPAFADALSGVANGDEVHPSYLVSPESPGRSQGAPPRRS